MSRKIPMIAGTIRIELESNCPAPWEADDSTLDLVLASFARRGTLADLQKVEPQRVRLATKRRLSWPAPARADLAVRTNLVQLLDDLQAEFERVAG
jgi:hypothetical protein